MELSLQRCSSILSAEENLIQWYGKSLWQVTIPAAVGQDVLSTLQHLPGIYSLDQSIPLNLPGPELHTVGYTNSHFTKSQRSISYHHLVWPICWDSLAGCGFCACYSYLVPQMRLSATGDQRWIISSMKAMADPSTRDISLSEYPREIIRVQLCIEENFGSHYVL